MLLCAAIMTMAAHLTWAQVPPLNRTDSIRVNLVTFYPGSKEFNIFGHSELRVQQGDQDWYYNYGVFNFEDPGFLWHFVLGHTDYMCMPVPRMFATEGMQGRRMIEQELNLSQEQARVMCNFLRANALPQNRTYRYKYLSDNCSTRPRDIIEMALGDSLHYGAMCDTLTYRDILAHYTRNYAWERFGIDLVLGWCADTVLSHRAQMFIPMLLMQAVDSATVTTAQGVIEPLNRHTTVVVDTSKQGKILPPTPWYASPMAMAVAVLAVTVGVTVRDWRRRRVSRWWDSLLMTAAGLAGVAVWFLMLFSTHEATSPNVNAVWINPLQLVLAVLLWVWRRGARWLYALQAVAVELTMALWWCQPQVANVAFFPLMAALFMRGVTGAVLLRGTIPSQAASASSGQQHNKSHDKPRNGNNHKLKR